VAETVNGRRCGAAEEHFRLLFESPEYQLNRVAVEANAFAFRMGAAESAREVPVRIPVVVHVVAHTPTQNISDEQIASQMTVLNEDFRAANGDFGNVPAVWQPIAADSQVEFYLAETDPSGNPTNGITRTQTGNASFQISNDPIKFAATGGADAWPADRYLNMWVAPEIRNGAFGGILGYATFPGAPAEIDGVVIVHHAFGTTGSAKPPFHLGRTATHEIGHWLNLFHIWGDDVAACNGSDFVDDTPNCANANTGCPSFPKHSCGNDPDGDMFMNYMDYVDDPCMCMFTAGQVNRMVATLNGPRATIGAS
jgi:hypothetical protein